MKRKSNEILVDSSTGAESDDDDFKDTNSQIKKAKNFAFKDLGLNNNVEISKSKEKRKSGHSTKAPRRSERNKLLTSSEALHLVEDEIESEKLNECKKEASNFESKKNEPGSLTQEPTVVKETKSINSHDDSNNSKSRKKEISPKSKLSKKKSKKGLSIKKINIISISDESDDEFISPKTQKSDKTYDIFSPKKQLSSDSALKTNPKNNNTPRKKKETLNSSKKKKETKSACKTPEKVPKIMDGFCPFCQMPFAALGIQSPNWHSMECMDLPLITVEECAKGVKCDSTIPSHYRKYRHTLLAQFRANKTLQPKTSENFGDESTSFDQDVTINDVSNVFVVQSNPSVIENGVTGVKESENAQKTNQKNSKISENYTLESDKDGVRHLVNEIENVTAFFPKESFPSESLVHDVDSEKIIEKTLESQKKINSETSDTFSCRSADSDILKSESGRSSSRPGCETESDEDIFLAETPDTPNFFTNVKKPENGSTQPELNPSQLFSKSGGFLQSGIDQDEELNAATKTAKTKNNPELSPIINTVQSPVIDLDKFVTKPTTSLNPGITKQTSLFSFFQSKSQSTNDTTSKIKFVTEEKLIPNKRTSLPNVNKVKSDAWGSLKRPKKSVSADETRPQGRKTINNKIATDTESDSTRNGRRKYSCPFYKKIPETGLTVDAFRYGEIPGCTGYILTHFHYDHYSGLTRKFQQPIYCSQVTGNLVESKLKVESRYINRLPMNKPCIVEGVELTLREANHCPGAVIIFMRLPSGRLILHTGDFRAHPSMESYPELRDNHINDLYLDTTYCNPDYAFPFQQAVIDFAVKMAVKTMKENPNMCIVCGTYTIGKERVFKAIAEAINSKICVKRDKKSIIDCLDDEDLKKRVTLNPEEASVHVLPMKSLNFNSLSIYLENQVKFDKILVFEPTGWTHSKNTNSLDQIQPKYSKNSITHYGIPYSEHSSFLELKRFVQFLKPTRILPTVNNGNPASRSKMEDLFASWLTEAQSIDRKHS